MNDRRHDPATPSPADGDGVRVIRTPRASRFGVDARAVIGVGVAVGIIVSGAVGWSLWRPDAASSAPAPLATANAAPTSPASAGSAATRAPAPAAVAARPLPVEFASRPGLAAPSGDPDDLASYFRPGDAVPSTGNLIAALRDAGVRGGIAAFNPPGTSPPLEGLAVPPDFELPPGYVRHHQASDDGTLIEPILMFSPDLVLRDAQGRVIPLPANRVVPPGMAPPGLPLRWVRPGTP